MNAQKCYLIIVLLSLAAGCIGLRRKPAFLHPAWKPTCRPTSIHNRFRLPLPRREDLDEAGRSAYDRACAPVPGNRTFVIHRQFQPNQTEHCAGGIELSLLNVSRQASMERTS
jgi:hypothetical protein